MKRKLAIATITTAALIGTGTVSAVALADDGDQKSAQVTSARYSDDDRDERNDKDRDDRDERNDKDRDERDDDRDDRSDDGGRDDDFAPSGLKVSAADAARKAESKGTVTSVDLDDDRKDLVWEVETTDKSGKQQEFLVDADSGELTQQTADDDRDDDRDDHDDRDERNDDRDDRHERDDDRDDH